MHAAILSLLEGEPKSDTLDSHLSDGLPAADVEATEYLDDRVIHHGTLAGALSEDTQDVFVNERGIHTETVEGRREVTTDIYADLDLGWAGVTAGDGQLLLDDYLASEAGVIPEPAVIDLEAWAEQLPDSVETNGIVYSQSVEDGHDRDAAGAKWHRDASPEQIPTEGVSALAISYTWDGTLVRGMLAASGYVAIWRDWSADTFARWVADEVEPFLHPEDDEQANLGSAEGVCDRCGRETDTNDAGLCIVCVDAKEREVTGDV